MQKLKYIPFFILFVACNRTQEIDTLKTEVLNTYAQIAFQNYQDIHHQVGLIRSKTNEFIANPSEPVFEALKKAWIDARFVYGQTEAFRFYGGPIDSPQTHLESRINAWPLDESYIDYVEGNEKSGIINDINVSIDKQTLQAKNEQNGVEENVSIGFHAVEFLLWGQDLYENSTGKRVFTDYTTAPNAERRRQYLLLCVELLLEDLQKLIDAWQPNSENYRASFVKNTEESLANILTGLGSLSRAELGGERMRVPLVNHDQEDEQSCFSDNTHRDIVANIQGIINIYEGRYNDFTGRGLAELIEKIAPTLHEKMQANLQATLQAAQAIQPPFDQEISGKNKAGNQRIQQVIKALDEQTDTIELIANALKVGINTKGS
jgi:putative iron-regulated protein